MRGEPHDTNRYSEIDRLGITAAKPANMDARPLSICLISEELPPETGWGGIGTYTHNLAAGLTKLGHRVHVVSRTWNDDWTRPVDGVRVHRVSVPQPSWRRGTRFVNSYFSETRDVWMWNLRVAGTIRRIARAERLDVIEVPEYHAQALLAAIVCPSVPFVVKLHTPAFLCRVYNGAGPGGSRLDTRISEYLEYQMVRRAAAVTAPEPEAR